MKYFLIILLFFVNFLKAEEDTSLSNSTEGAVEQQEADFLIHFIAGGQWLKVDNLNDVSAGGFGGLGIGQRLRNDSYKWYFDVPLGFGANDYNDFSFEVSAGVLWFFNASKNGAVQFNIGPTFGTMNTWGKNSTGNPADSSEYIKNQTSNLLLGLDTSFSFFTSESFSFDLGTRLYLVPYSVSTTEVCSDGGCGGRYFPANEFSIQRVGKLYISLTGYH